MANLSLNEISRDGLLYAVTAAASGGDAFTNDGRTFLAVYNEHVSASRTVTIAIQADVDGQTPNGIEVTVAAGATQLVGPFPPRWYNDANGRVQMTYSDSGADLYVGAFKLPL
jgi:hypothetical protein